jgi:hypothetical protein
VKKDVFLLIDDIVTWLQLKGGEEREKKVMKKKKLQMGTGRLYSLEACKLANKNNNKCSPACLNK